MLHLLRWFDRTTIKHALRPKWAIPLLLILIIGAISSGCGSDVTGPSGDLSAGTFTATLSGGLSASFQGLARYSIGGFQDGTGNYQHDFGLVTVPGALPAFFAADVRMCRPNSELPSGTYPLVDRWEWRPFDESGIEFFFRLPDGREGDVEAFSGSLSINRSGDGPVTGSIQGSGSVLVEIGGTETEVSVNLTADFATRPPDFGDFPSQFSCPFPW